MTLLGVPDVKFSVGTKTEPTVDMSLDEMIASRRKEQIKSRRSGGRPKVSAADRSLGAGRAKRDAAVAARRGIRQSSSPGTKAKPTAMEIEREVYRQSRQSAANAETRRPRGRPRKNPATPTPDGVPAPLAARRGRGRGRGRGGAAAATTAAAAPNNVGSGAPVIPAPRAPSKKVMNAAVTAMSEHGFKVPDGMQMMITFAPVGSTTVAAPVPNAAPTPAAAPKPATTPRRGGNRGARGQRGRGAQNE